MSDLGLKTPVSYLQEYLVSRKLIPQYELIHNGTGTHKPQFTFRVQVEALWEEGTGKSKREAKHRAAEKMLKTLKIIDAKDDDMEMGEFSKEELPDNFVGQLKDLCINLHYPEPKYYLEESAGPPHSRIFKMICCVSQMKDFGISKTKKQAKHQAASKMLQRLKEVGGKKIEDALMNNETPNRITASTNDDEAIEKYTAIKHTSVNICKDPAAFYKDNHNAYISLTETSPTLNKLLEESNVTDTESSLSLLEKVAEELNVTLSTVETPKKDSTMKFTIMTMSVIPPIGGVGLSKEQAAFNLLNSLLVLCKK